MHIRQVITMLLACEAQGATQVRIAARSDEDHSGISSKVDWISPEPVDGTAYIGALEAQGEWSHMDNRALLQLDW